MFETPSNSINQKQQQQQQQQQKLGTIIWCNWEYAREEILANNYVSIFDSHDFFIIIKCSKNFLKSSIASFISYAKESPEAYLEPCQISMKKIFCKNS